MDGARSPCMNLYYAATARTDLISDFFIGVTNVLWNFTYFILGYNQNPAAPPPVAQVSRRVRVTVHA